MGLSGLRGEHLLKDLAEGLNSKGLEQHFLQVLLEVGASQKGSPPEQIRCLGVARRIGPLRLGLFRAGCFPL